MTGRTFSPNPRKRGKSHHQTPRSTSATNQPGIRVILRDSTTKLRREEAIRWRIKSNIPGGSLLQFLIAVACDTGRSTQGVPAMQNRQTGKWTDVGSNPLGLFLQNLWLMDTVLWLCPHNWWNIKMARTAARLNAEPFLRWRCSEPPSSPVPDK